MNQLSQTILELKKSQYYCPESAVRNVRRQFCSHALAMRRNVAIICPELVVAIKIRSAKNKSTRREPFICHESANKTFYLWKRLVETEFQNDFINVVFSYAFELIFFFKCFYIHVYLLIDHFFHPFNQIIQFDKNKMKKKNRRIILMFNSNYLCEIKNRNVNFNLKKRYEINFFKLKVFFSFQTFSIIKNNNCKTIY